MLDKPLLGGFVIIGRDHEDGISTGIFRVLRGAQGVCGIVAADPGDHFHASVDGAHRHADKLVMLVRRMRRVFAGRAADHDSRGAVLILELKVLFKSLIVHAVLTERRNYCSARTFENRYFNHNSLHIEDFITQCISKFHDLLLRCCSNTVESAIIKRTKTVLKEERHLKKSDFYFDLPQELIAQTPLERRDGSRLLLRGNRAPSFL